jgi:hypothetical protein
MFAATLTNVCAHLLDQPWLAVHHHCAAILFIIAKIVHETIKVITRSHPPEGKGRIPKNPNTLRKNLTVEESPTLPMTPPIAIQLVLRKWLQMAANGCSLKSILFTLASSHSYIAKHFCVATLLSGVVHGIVDLAKRPA